jgi:hypothetical protein
MNFSFSDNLNLQLDGLPPINFNSVETLPGYNARAAFTVNSSSVFKEDELAYRKFEYYMLRINHAANLRIIMFTV